MPASDLYHQLVERATQDDLVLITPHAEGLDCISLTLNKRTLRLVKLSSHAGLGLTIETLIARHDALADAGVVFDR